MPSMLFEEKSRILLEEWLWIRPRTKEFLIGYPFLLFSFLQIDKFISRKWVWFFNVIGAIALISLVNSFCHIHTPLNISIYRTCLGVLLGGVVGGIYLGMFYMFHRLYKRVL